MAVINKTLGLWRVSYMNNEYKNNQDWSDSEFMDIIGVILFFAAVIFTFIFAILVLARM